MPERIGLDLRHDMARITPGHAVAGVSPSRSRRGATMTARPARPARPGQPAGLLDTIEFQRFGCVQNGSHLYGDVLDAVHRDVSGAGPCADVLRPHAAAPFADAIVLRFLGGVHRLVLEGRAPELAEHYPSAGGEPHPGVGPAFVATVAAHQVTLARRMHDGVQTNEVGRSASLLGGFLAAATIGGGLPLRILEVGASAGLNLRFDGYRYESGLDSFGPADSPLRFVDPWAAGGSTPLPGSCTVLERRGCDIAPIDPTTADGRLTLRSYVWPDQSARFERLDSALEVAGLVPAPVDRAEAGPWLRARLADPVPGVVTVVVHSIMFQYLSRLQQRELLEVTEEAGQCSSPDAPFAWLRMEPGGEHAEIRLTTWPGRATRLLATSTYHGPPVRWVDEHVARRESAGAA